jgi:thiol-disulfide isomerase/thioredoxin
VGGEGTPIREESLASDFILNDLDARQFRLSDFQGSVVVINFWATWCGPCRAEMPSLEERYQRYKDEGLIIFAVDYDEPPEVVRAYRDELELSFPVLLDPGGVVQRLYQIRGYPTSVFVDEWGLVRFRHIGVMSDRQIDSYLNQLGFDA